MSQKPTFTFLDETGTLSVNDTQRYFGVGAITDSYPDKMLSDLHNAFEQLSSDLKRIGDPCLEFKFTDVKTSSIHIYKKCIEILAQYSSWRFCCLIIDKQDGKYTAPTNAQEMWEAYLRYTKLLLKHNLHNDERVVMIADFFKQPKGKVHELATLPQVIPQLVDTLQVESQGLLLVQMSDILLGATVYEGKDKLKLELAQYVKSLEAKVGKRRFNVWRIKWNYSF